jgi:prepilin-type N-terminal cleavage/methylation domain-containing protein
MEMFVQNKQGNFKGFTLIEVVVALGILTVALVGSITLVISVVNLAMVTRDQTEATALLQQGMSDAQSKVIACCGKPDPTFPTPYKITTSIPPKTLKVTVLSDFQTVEPFTKERYYKVTAEVTWKFRENPKEFKIEATEYLRKDQK